MKKRIPWVAVLTMIVALLPLTAVSADGPPGVSPAEVEAIVFPGQSVDIDKVVHTPYVPVPPMPDIYFLADTTGSMGSVINQVKTDAAAVLAAIQAAAPTAAFGAGDYKDFPHDAYAFNNGAAITDDAGVAALAEIATWTASGGYDGSEGQFYALDRLITGADWRPGATPIVVWFGDAPGHDPICSAISGLGYDITEASLTEDLVAAGIRVVAISTLTGFTDGLNDDPTISAGNYGACSTINGTPGQADRIAEATGGASLIDVPSEDIAAAILRGLESVAIDVGMYSDCAPPITTTFDPETQTVPGGSDALFLENIAVNADAPGGTYYCNDYVTVNDEDLYTYVVTQGDTTFNVGALASIQDVDAYYAYNKASDVPAGPFNASSARIDIEQSETSLLFLYTDGANLSLVMLHDRPEAQLGETPATGGLVDMTVTGLPSVATWVVRDDDPGNDAFPASPLGTLEANWEWLPCCTDGGAIAGGLYDHLSTGGCINVDPTFTSGINDWLFLTGDRNDPDAYALALDEPVEICAEQVIEHKTIKVPEGFLTGGGQIGKGPRGSNFGGNVGYLADFSVVGQWQFQGTAGSGEKVKMHSTSIEYLQFSNNAWEPPDPPPANANVADFGGIARVKVDKDAWLEGCTFVAQAQDHGEPSKKGDPDVFGIQIDCSGVGAGGPWTFGREFLDAGNLQIHSGLKD